MCGALLDKSSQPPALSTADWRRRSADLGGLLLATKNPGQGQGWLGGSTDEPVIETVFAEVLSDMYNETVHSVNDNSLDLVPTDLSESVRSRLIHALDRWHFEPHLLPDEEVIACTLILFETLFRIEGMQEAIPVSMQQISAFIHHLRRIYRYENTYHNFEHALDVLQACQSYLKSAGLIPSPTILFTPNQLWRPQLDSGRLVTSLGLQEVFILYIAAIGHDVGHPGLTNLFMKNARTRLSLVYDDSSPLENMHYHFLLRLMRFHGLNRLLEEPVRGQQLRKLLFQTIIATDMSVHDDFMKRFRKLVDGEKGTLCMRQILVAQAILKNADISNPSRPFVVSKHWANALMKEWAVQAQFEEENNLKPTVPSSLDDPLKEARSQIFFISTYVKPLLQLTEAAIPEMRMFAVHCKTNLKTWKGKESALLKAGATCPIQPSSTPNGSLRSTSTRQVTWYHTAFPLTLPDHHHASSSTYSLSTVTSTAPTNDSHGSSAPASPSEESASGSGSSLFSPISDAASSLNGAGGWRHASSALAGSTQRSTTDPSHTRPSTSSSSSATSSLPNPPSLHASASSSSVIFTNTNPFDTSPSTSSHSHQNSITTHDAHAAIRAAGKVGSLKLKRSRVNLNRSSWCVPNFNPEGARGPSLMSLFSNASASSSSSVLVPEAPPDRSPIPSSETTPVPLARQQTPRHSPPSPTRRIPSARGITVRVGDLS